MSQSGADNLAGGLQAILALGIMLLGLVVMLRGVAIIGWLLSGVARLLMPLAGILLRGLVILAVLGAIYLFVSRKIAERHQGRGTGSVPAQPTRVGRSHDYAH